MRRAPFVTLVCLLSGLWAGCQPAPPPPRTLEGVQSSVHAGMTKAEVQRTLGMPDEQTSGLNAMWVYRVPGGGDQAIAVVFAGDRVDTVSAFRAGP